MKIDFEKYHDGLAPVIIQDPITCKVLMLGFMNEAALEMTTALQKVTFFSRSKNRLWMKGEKSGNFLSVIDIITDCDKDTLLIKAIPAGPVCHTGADTCFNEKNMSTNFLATLESTIAGRKLDPSQTSYTSSLFQSGINKIAQKVGEESIELIIESKDDNIELFKNEAADLLFHYLVLLQAKGCFLSDIETVLLERSK